MDNKETSQNNHRVIRIIVVASIVVTIIALYSILMLTNPPKKMAGHNYLDEPKNNFTIGGSFNLIDTNNEPFTDTKLHGKISIIYFGFAFCPDICPTALEKISETLDILGKYNIDVNTAFITIDPKRDTPESLKQFLQSFHPSIIGLSGSNENIVNAAKKYRVYHEIDKNSTADGNYLINHSSFIYIMSPEGRYMNNFSLDSSPLEIANFIRMNK